MRHRFLCPLHNKHPKHQEVIDHLHQFNKNDRGRELALLVVAGYQAIYGRNPDAAPASIHPDLTDLLNQMAAIHQGGRIPQPQQFSTEPLAQDAGNHGNQPQDHSRGSVQESDSAPSGAVHEDEEKSKLEHTKDKNNESEKPLRNLTPPKSSRKPDEGLLDEPPEPSGPSDEIVDPLTSLGKMFR